jgi:hypothetical protein
MHRLGIFQSTIRGLHDELSLRLQVLDVVNDLVHSVDVWSIKNEAIKVVDDLGKYKRRCAWLFMKLQAANSEKKLISENNALIKVKADNIREKVVLDIGSIIREGKKLNQLYEKISNLEENISEMSGELEVYRSREQQQAAVIAANVELAAVVTTTANINEQNVSASKIPTIIKIKMQRQILWPIVSFILLSVS